MKFFLFLYLFVFSLITLSQEVCDNAIDDDGDGLIDLNDDECTCSGLPEIRSLIPNHSFEEKDCCPTGSSQMHCATTWGQASDGTTDYFNTCGITSFLFSTAPDLPLPGEPDGEGYSGILSSPGWKEYIGACLDQPMLAGVTYTLSLYVARGYDPIDLDLGIFGTPNCADLPWEGLDCPIGMGDWELLATNPVSLPTLAEWQEVSLTFTPGVDIYAIGIGWSCAPIDIEVTYFYVDELTLLREVPVFYEIESTGGWCSGDLELSVDIDLIGGTWQWYKNGVALIGETDPTIEPVSYGLGEFAAVYSLDGYCEMFVYTPITDGVTANFITEDICLTDTAFFENTSSVVEPDDFDNWEWKFGDGFEESSEDAMHIYTDTGTYTVELIATTESGCKDTAKHTITVHDLPEFFAFTSDITEGCEPTTILFTDLTDSDSSLNQTIWYIDGQTHVGNTISHTFTEAGTYEVALDVLSPEGCVTSVSDWITSPFILYLLLSCMQLRILPLISIHKLR